MKKALIIAGLSLLKTRKEKLFIIIMIAMALVFTAVIGMVFASDTSSQQNSIIPIGVLDNDRTKTSENIIKRLEESGIYKVFEKDEDDIYENVRERKYEAGYIIPKGFEASLASNQPLKLQVINLTISNATSSINKIIEGAITDHILSSTIIDIYVDQIGEEDIDLAASGDGIIVDMENMNKNPILKANYRAVEQTDNSSKKVDNSFHEVAMGMVVQFTMFTIVFGVSEILDEKKYKTWARLLATPTSKASILAGKLMGVYLIGAMQIAILIGAGKGIFNVNYGNNILDICALMAVFLLSATGIGLFISTIVKTSAQMQAIAPIVIVSTSMLGGCFWPVDIAPPIMQNIAKFTPQAWTMAAFKDIALRGKNLSEVLLNIIVLLIFALIFFSISIRRLKYE